MTGPLDGARSAATALSKRDMPKLSASDGDEEVAIVDEMDARPNEVAVASDDVVLIELLDSTRGALIEPFLPTGD